MDAQFLGEILFQTKKNALSYIQLPTRVALMGDAVPLKDKKVVHNISHLID